MAKQGSALSLHDIELSIYPDFKSNCVHGIARYNIQFALEFETTIEDVYSVIAMKESLALSNNPKQAGILYAEYMRLYQDIQQDPTILSSIACDTIKNYNDHMRTTNYSTDSIDFCMQFEIPNPEICVIARIAINDAISGFTIWHPDADKFSKIGGFESSNSLAEFDHDNIHDLSSRTSAKLLVNVPLTVLRLHLLRILKSELPGQGVDNINIDLNLALWFKLDSPTPLTSSLYFQTHGNQRSTDFPIEEWRLLACTKPGAWFPVPSKKVHAQIPISINVLTNLETFVNGTMIHYDKVTPPAEYGQFEDFSNYSEVQSRLYQLNTRVSDLCLVVGDLERSITSIPNADSRLELWYPKIVRSQIAVSTDHLAKCILVLHDKLLGGDSCYNDNDGDGDESGCRASYTLLFLPTFSIQASYFDVRSYGSLTTAPCEIPLFDDDAKLVHAFSLFSSCAILDWEYLHSEIDFGESVRLKKLGQFEAIVSLAIKWPEHEKAYARAWIRMATRKYLTLLLYREIYGSIQTTVLVRRLINAYCNAVERGYEKQPLSVKSSTVPWSTIEMNATVYELKSSVLFIALEALVVSTSKGKHFLPSDFFKEFLFDFIHRNKFGDKFFNNLRIRIKTLFVSSGLHKKAKLPPTEVFNQAEYIEGLPEVISVDDIDPILYRSHPLYDIGEVVQDIFNFEETYVYGTGAAMSVCALCYGIQKKSEQLEELKVRLDQTPLLPPTLIQNGESYWRPSLMACGPLLDRLLRDINDNSSTIGDSEQGDNFRGLISKLLTQSNDAYHLLSQLNLNMEAFTWDPRELILKDNKHYFCFGHLGDDTSPVCGGTGQLYASAFRQLYSYWQPLTPEERSIMASDTSAMEHQIASGQIPRINMSSTGGAPQWLPNLLVWQVLRNISFFEQLPTKINPIGIAMHKALVWSSNTSSSDDVVCASALPSSSNSNLVYPVYYGLRFFEDAQVTDQMVAIRSNVIVTRKTIKDPAIPVVLNETDKVSKPRILATCTKMIESLSRGDTIKFDSISFPHVDAMFFSSAFAENVRVQFTPPSKLNEIENDGNDFKAARPIPILWARYTEDSINIGRERRYQSVAMWLHQLMHDSCVMAQMEAVSACSELCAFPDAIEGLFLVTTSLKYHPSVRSLAAAALTRAAIRHNQLSGTLANLLINHIFFVYADPLTYASIISTKKQPEEPMLEWQLLESYGVQIEEHLHELGIPPAFSPTGLYLLGNILADISQLRNSQNETPPVVYAIFNNYLSQLPTPVDLKLAKSTDNVGRYLPCNDFLSSLVACIPNLSFVQAGIDIDIREIVERAQRRINSEDAMDDENDRHGNSTLNNSAINVKVVSDVLAEVVPVQVLALFNNIITRIDIERKIGIHNHKVTASFLDILPKIPLFQKLYRLRSLVRFSHPDVLLIFTPVIRMVLPQLETLLPWVHDDPLATGSCYSRLLVYKGYANVVPETLEAPWNEITFQSALYTSHSLCYTSRMVHCKALRAVFSLVLQGQLIPPGYLRDASVALLTKRSNSDPRQLIGESLDVTYDIFSNEGPLNFTWVDDKATQIWLMRCGLAVLYASKLACSLDMLYPFTDTADLVPLGWNAYFEALDKATTEYPECLFAYLVDEGAVQCVKGLLSKLERRHVNSKKKGRKPLEPHIETKQVSPEVDIFEDEFGTGHIETVGDDWEHQLLDDQLEFAFNPSHNTSAERSDRPKRKRRRKLLESLPQDVDVIVPPMITTYELLMSFLSYQAPTFHTITEPVVQSVREIIYFLFGIAVPRLVSIANSSIAEVLSELNSSTSTELAAYPITFRAPSSQYSAICESRLKSINHGIQCKPVIHYTKLNIAIWSYCKKLEKWPLPLEYNWKHAVSLITDALVEHPSCGWFINEVNAMENPNYYKVIKTPMWFCKVIEKLRTDQYTHFEQWKNDIYTIFRNCRTYNQKGSTITEDCEAVQALSYQLLHFVKRVINVDEID